MSNTNILALNDSELYVLACVLGSVQYNKASISLLCKVHEVSDKKFGLICEDYEKVVFYVNDSGDSRTGKVAIDQFVTVAFEGNSEQDSNEEVGVPVVIDVRQQLIDALSVAISQRDLDAVTIYSNALHII